MRLAVTLLLLSSVVALDGCYSENIADGQYTCISDDGECPGGFLCRCAQCVQPSSHPTCDAPDLLMKGDGPTVPPGDMIMPPSPCGIGMPAAVVGTVAFCPAAWRAMGGIHNEATPCDRKPAPNGKSADGTIDCAPGDNCASGWHMCRDDNEVSANGLTNVDDCGKNAPQGFWATRLASLKDDFITCAPPGNARLMGCGSIGAATMACSILQRAFGKNDCSNNPPWECNHIMDAAALVIKTALDKGGVLCCQDPIGMDK